MERTKRRGRPGGSGFDRQYLQYQADYWKRPKRCSLWRVDPDALAVTFILDLPSRGDTCFPGLLDLGGNDYAVYNDSSPLEGEDVAWYTGQFGPTRIYRALLAMPPRHDVFNVPVIKR